METEYNKKIIERMDLMPKFQLGQLVKTPDGEGIIVELKMVWNGLYISEETAKATIWYSTDEAQKGWVSNTYSLNELSVVACFKTLDQCDVSGQLLAFLKWYREEQPITCDHKAIVEKYLKASNLR